MQQRWQDYAGLVLGVLLFLSPWIVGFSGVQMAAASAWAIGVATVALFALALFKADFRREAEWVNVVLAVILLAAPFVLGFTGAAGAAYTHWILAVLIGADAIWAIADMRGQAHGTA